MAEMYTDKRRAVFKKGLQRRFLNEVLTTGKISTEGLSSLCGVHIRTVQDWTREKYSMPLRSLELIKKVTGIEVKKQDLLGIKEQYWYTLKGARLGGIARFKKYGGISGDEKNRLRLWRKWWAKNKHKHPVIGKTKAVILPKKTALLAEFIGIVMGDGGLTAYQCLITLNAEADYQYSIWVRTLIKKLFGTEPRVLKRKESKALVISVSRRLLVDFLVRLGLKRGNKLKQNLRIPKWIMKKNDLAKACLRGLVDTDGCVVIEKHVRKSGKYKYCKINLVSWEPALIKQAFNICSRLGIKAHIRRKGQSMQVEKYEEICKYMRIVGTHNPKHAARFKSVTGRSV